MEFGESVTMSLFFSSFSTQDRQWRLKGETLGSKEVDDGAFESAGENDPVRYVPPILSVDTRETPKVAETPLRPHRDSIRLVATDPRE